VNKRLIIIAFFLIALILDSSGQGCAMCKAVAEDGVADNENTVGLGLNTGILYLMTVPYIILFFLFRKKLASFYREFMSIHK